MSNAFGSSPLARNETLPVAQAPTVGARIAYALACAWVALLASCGGGGGGDADSQAAAPVQPLSTTTAPTAPGTPTTPATPAEPPEPTAPTIPTTPAPPVATPPAIPQVAPGTWVVMGSSTAAGAGATSQSWAERVQTTYAPKRVDVANIAKGGTTTYSGLPSSSSRIAGRPAPDPAANVDAAVALSPRLVLVLVAYPTNDTAFGFTADETVRNLLAIRAAALARGAAVIVLSTQPAALTEAKLALLPQIDSRVSAQVGPCFVAVREALATSDGRLRPIYDSGDGVHPTTPGML